MNENENMIVTDSEEQNNSMTEQTIKGENVYYKSEQLVPLLGIDADQIRYRAKEYNEFLHTNKTQGGHLRFTDHDIEMLRTIQHLMDSGYSKTEIKAFLRDPEARIVIAGNDSDETKEIKELLASSEYLVKRLTSVYSETLTMAVSTALSEQAAQMQNIKALEDKNREDEISRINASLEKLLEQNELLMNQLIQTNEELTLLKEEKNKKGFLGLFRK